MSTRPNIWHPLDPSRRQIRLFHLEPSENIHDQAEGFLEIVSLDDDPRYEALSYTWGYSKITGTIKLHKIQWEVTTNLEAGLRHLRGDVEEKVLWIDAICIDQGSNEEKNYQVPLMRTIYANASIVRVWLGESTDGSDEAMGVFNELGNGNPPRLANVRIDGRPLDMGNVKNLRDLLTRPWWRRIWVQQEFVLATRLALHCGSRCLNHDTLSTFDISSYEIISGWNYSTYDYTVFSEMWQGFSNLHYFLGMRQTHVQLGHAQRSPGHVQSRMRHFLRSLSYGRNFHCANPRDSIYGLLGLAPNDFASIVDPDYNSSVAEVLQHTAVLLILYTNSLTIFSAAVFQQKKLRMVPTWVPDWRNSAGAIRTEEANSHKQLILASYGLFNACGQRKLRFELESDSVVTLSGIILDHVEAMTAAITGEDTPNKRRIETDWRRFFDYHIKGTLKSFYLGSESPMSPYWRLLTCDLRPELKRCKVEDRENYITWASVEEVAANDVARDFHKLFFPQSVRLFFTANGFVGTGPNAVEPGDSIYVLAGGPLPYVLRPVPDAACVNTFELVGSCYVHGVMDGQAVDGLGEDEPPLPDLNLPKTEWHDIHLV